METITVLFLGMPNEESFEEKVFKKKSEFIIIMKGHRFCYVGADIAVYIGNDTGPLFGGEDGS